MIMFRCHERFISAAPKWMENTCNYNFKSWGLFIFIFLWSKTKSKIWETHLNNILINMYFSMVLKFAWTYQLNFIFTYAPDSQLKLPEKKRKMKRRKRFKLLPEEKIYFSPATPACWLFRVFKNSTPFCFCPITLFCYHLASVYPHCCV